MSPFDVSAIDFVLLVVILVLILLLVNLRRDSSVAEPQLNNNNHRRLLEEHGKTETTAEEDTLQMQSAKSIHKCGHRLDYLRTTPRSSSIPDECQRCPKAIRCFPQCCGSAYTVRTDPIHSDA